MDFGIASVAGITVICYLIGRIIKATGLDNKWIPCIVGNEVWAPGAAPALWAPYHATSAKWALPWMAPTGAHDAYQAGEYMRWADGLIYRCKVDATVHGPVALPSAWEVAT